jgi:hypothetical protein
LNYSHLEKDYLEYYDFTPLVNKYFSKSEEVYFGVDNPLRVGLIHRLTIIKELITKTRESNPSINALELIDICKDEFNKLANVIEDSFNVEKCVIGFQNSVNAACFSQIYNKKIVGISESSHKMRVKLDDIIETKNGFRYKNGKGIYYAICIGLQFFYSDEFTIPEIASTIVHELGHAMQHVIYDINAEYAIAYWTHIIKNIELCNIFELNPRTEKMLSLIKQSALSKDYDKLSKLGEEILNETPENEMLDFKKLTSQELTAICNDDIPIDGSDLSTIPKKRNIFLRTIIGLIKIPLSILFAIFLVPIILSYKSKLNEKTSGVMKKAEMTADAFEVFYGFGAESGESMRKLSKYRKNLKDQGLINYVPLLNLWKVSGDMKREFMSMIFGYPSDKQRITNAYVNCEFELNNNKDLSEEAKKELREQMNSLRDTYNEFVSKQDTKGGFIYKIASIIGANTIEKAAKKDNSLRETILEPLMKKRNAGAFNK